MQKRPEKCKFEKCKFEKCKFELIERCKFSYLVVLLLHVRAYGTVVTHWSICQLANTFGLADLWQPRYERLPARLAPHPPGFA